MQDATGKSRTVGRVVTGELCSGCGLCAAVAPDAIRMELIPPGYARPVQFGGVSPEAERLIADSCPGAIVEP